jgi:hypothetical protein
MNIIYTILRIMKILGLKENGENSKTIIFKDRAPFGAGFIRMAHNVKFVIKKIMIECDGFLKSMKRCV